MENPVADLADRAASLNRARQHGEALEAIEHAVELAGLTPALDLMRADALIGLERFQDAYDVTRNLLERGGDGARARSLLFKARILRRSSQWIDDALEAAIEAASAAARQGDLARRICGEAHLEAARCYGRKGCRTLAERELERAEPLMDGAGEVGFYRGAILVDFDDRPGARRVYEAMLEAGDEARYHGTVGLAYLEYVMGEFAAAHARLDELAPLASSDLWPRRIRLMLLESEHRWDELADGYAELRQASPQADSVWRDAYERAHALYRAGHLDQAREACESLLAQAPEGVYQVRLAQRMARLLGHPEVEHRARRRLKAFPSVTQLHNHCGPASCELYLRYFGLTDSQVEIARKIKSPDGGTPVYKMRRYLDEAGFTTRRVEADLPTLRRLIDAGIPVIMEESYSSSSHVAVAIGYDDALELLEVQDPMTHRVRETFYEDLAELRNLSNHGALIAAPSDQPELVRALDEASNGECRYIALVDEAWAALDDDRAADGDALVEQALELEREYEYAWMYQFRRARERAGEDPTPENRVAIHQVLGEITSIWPDDEWPQQLLGRALFFDDRVGEALVAFERARDRDPGDPYNWSMIADCNLELGNHDAAYDALVEALARDPSYVRPNENLADLARRRGRMVLAWALNDAARELNPDNPFNHAVHGQLLEADDRNEDALAAFRHAIELDPERDWVRDLEARLLRRMDRADEAVAVRRGLVARRPDNVGHEIDLADLLYDIGRASEAVEVCDTVLARDPDNASAHAIRAAAKGKQGDLDEALAGFDRALTRRPTYVWVYKEMGHLFTRHEQMRQAIQAFAAALGMSSGNAYRELELGDALIRAGHLQDGVRHLREAATYGNLPEDELRRVGEMMVEAYGGRYADDFFSGLSERRPSDLAVLRAHAHTMLEVCWAPGAAEPVLEALIAADPDDTFALTRRGSELLYHSMEGEANGEELLREVLEREPENEYARRVLGESLVERGRFEAALEVLAPTRPSYQNDKLRVQAHLGLDDYDGAAAVIAEFAERYGQPDEPCLGAMMLEYLVARRRYDWAKALELAEAVSRGSHERDDDGRLDTWEEERFECLAHLGQTERALRFGLAQATDADSLASLAYAAYHADQMELAGELAARALRLDPAAGEALAVLAINQELAGDIDGAITTWERVGEVEEDWHTWQEQLGRIALGRGDIEAALHHANAGVALGHLCPWSFGVRAQARLLAGDRDGAAADLERSWQLAAPESRENDAADLWAIRAALAGDAEGAATLFDAYLASKVESISDNDRERVTMVRDVLSQ